MRSICNDEGMPVCSTVFKWLSENKDFSEQYARAREIQAEIMADEIIEIADDSTNDFMEMQKKNGATVLVCDQENINRARLRVDSRKWVAAKLLPKKYGDKQTVEHEGRISIAFKRDPETPPVSMPTTPSNA
jgi:hypothetical protein